MYLSILTSPAALSYRAAGKVWIRSGIDATRRIVKGGPVRSGYGGHHAVTRSAVEGLRKIGYAANYNPRLTSGIANTAVVLSGFDALEQAICLKKKGTIKRLLAGPNLVVVPSDQRALITAKEIDVYLVNSEWTRSMYLTDAPELTGRCMIWPAGVDANIWRPSQERGKSVLIYQKTEDMEIIDQCEAWLNQSGYEVSRIVYGRYTEHEYLARLRKSAFAVFFSKSESQGIALAEAWSTDVPTLVWDPGYAISHPGTSREMRWQASSAPYLTPATGMRFVNSEEFETALSACNRDVDQFAPRHWVLDHMSDEASARKLLAIAGLGGKSACA